MEFQDFYANYLRSQQLKGACETMKQDENDYDTQQQYTNSVTNYTTRPISTANFNSNSHVMQDEQTMKLGQINGIANNNNQKGGVIGYTNNHLKHQQKQLEANNLRVFGRELGNVEQDRSGQQNGMQNNSKNPQTQNFMKPMGYTKLEKKNNNPFASTNNNNNQQNDPFSKQHNNQNNSSNQMKRNMSVEYINNNNNGNENQKISENNFYSRNSGANSQIQMVDENQSRSSCGQQNNAYKANTCKASFDKENFANQISSSVMHNNFTSRSRNTMDVENCNSIKSTPKLEERRGQSEYTFPKDKMQKDPIYQYARTIFDYLRNNEEQYCAKGTMSNVQEEINVRMRAIMVDWLVDVHHKFKLLPDTLFLTINLIDRFIERQNITKDRLQLLGATSMFVACKYEEIYPPEINDFVFICDSLYTKEQILQMEGELITAINFDLTYTSPLRFLDRYSYLNESTDVQYYCAQYLLELSLIEYSMTEYSSSNQAASALYLVNKIFDQPWSDELRSQSHYNATQLKKCAVDMYTLLQKSNEFQLKYYQQVAEMENQEYMQIAQLKQWYNAEKAKLESLPEFIQEQHEQLEIDFSTQRKQIEDKIKEIKNSLLCNNKNLVAIIRKFSLPKFKEPAKLLFSFQYPFP